MKALITSDLHLTSRGEDEYRFDVFEKLRNIIKVKGSDEVGVVILAGDIFDNCDRHTNALLLRTVGEIVSLRDAGVQVWVMKGNHCYTDDSEPTLSFLEHIPGIEYVSQPRVLHLGRRRVAMLPHSYEWDPNRPLVGMIPLAGLKSSWSLIVMHQTVQGAISESGVELAGEVPLSMISEEETKGTPVISGDIHLPQTIGNVTYCGAPHSIRYGDHYDPRIICYDLKTKTYESIPNPGPKRIRLVLQLSDRGWERLNDAPEPEAGDSVKIRVRGGLREQLRWSQIYRDVREKFEELDVHVAEVRFDLVDEVDMSNKPVDVEDRTLSDAEVFEKFCEFESVPEKYREGSRRWLPWCFKS